MAAFGMIDALGLAVFFVIEAQLFTQGQVAAVPGQVARFLPLDVLLAAFQTNGLPGIEPAGGDAVSDAALFVVQATVHFMDAGTTQVDGAGVVCHGEGAQHGGKCESEKRFHGVGG